jgi:type II secretory pathway pseudopilin PulG
MNATYVIVGVIMLVVIAAAILLMVIARRNKTKKLQSQFGSEYDHTLEMMGGKKKGQSELEARQKHIKTLNIRPLTLPERGRYLADWTALQSKFVDEPGQAVIDADHLIMEVMQLRDYPLSDFDQRAADISVTHPGLVGNYRSARAIAVKNEQKQANTEELRQAILFYRSLFDELVGKGTPAA